jgi:hypothetical protein
MEYRVRINLLSTAVVIALGVVVSTITSTVVAARAYQSRIRQTASSQREITVKGSAREHVTSDIGVWTVTVSGEGKTLPEAFGVLDAGAAKVAAFLREQGFGDGEVVMASIETKSHYALDANGKTTWNVEGYDLSRQVTVTSPAVEKMTKAGGEVTKLIKDGVAVSSCRPRFYFTKIADLKVQILGEAAKDAMTRAQEIAKNSAGAVGAVRNVQMGVLQITQPNSTQVSGEGIYDTDTIEKDVSAVVTVTYGIES